MKQIIYDAITKTTTEIEVPEEEYQDEIPPQQELSEIEKLKLRQDATENAILFIMDMGGMI